MNIHYFHTIHQFIHVMFIFCSVYNAIKQLMFNHFLPVVDVVCAVVDVVGIVVEVVGAKINNVFRR